MKKRICMVDGQACPNDCPLSRLVDSRSEPKTEIEVSVFGAFAMISADGEKFIAVGAVTVRLNRPGHEIDEPLTDPLDDVLDDAFGADPEGEDYFAGDPFFQGRGGYAEVDLSSMLPSFGRDRTKPVFHA